jgi:hypothetical protein
MEDKYALDKNDEFHYRYHITKPIPTKIPMQDGRSFLQEERASERKGFIPEKVKMSCRNCHDCSGMYCTPNSDPVCVNCNKSALQFNGIDSLFK